MPGPTFGFVKLLASSGSHCTKWADEQHRPAGFESRLVLDLPIPFIPTLIGLRAFDLVSSPVWSEAATNKQYRPFSSGYCTAPYVPPTLQYDYNQHWRPQQIQQSTVSSFKQPTWEMYSGIIEMCRFPSLSMVPSSFSTLGSLVGKPQLANLNRKILLASTQRLSVERDDIPFRVVPKTRTLCWTTTHFHLIGEVTYYVCVDDLDVWWAGNG